MRQETRFKFNAYMSRVAELNGIDPEDVSKILRRAVRHANHDEHRADVLGLFAEKLISCRWMS